MHAKGLRSSLGTAQVSCVQMALDTVLEGAKVPGGKEFEDVRKCKKYHSDKPENICKESFEQYLEEAGLAIHRCGPQMDEVADSTQ